MHMRSTILKEMESDLFHMFKFKFDSQEEMLETVKIEFLGMEIGDALLAYYRVHRHEFDELVRRQNEESRESCQEISDAILSVQREHLPELLEGTTDMKPNLLKSIKKNANDLYIGLISIILFTTVALVLASRCSEQTSMSDKWPDELKAQFLTACEGDKPSDVKLGLCRCLLSEMADKGKIPTRALTEGSYYMEGHLDDYFKSFQGLMLIQECASRVQADRFVL